MVSQVSSFVASLPVHSGAVPQDTGPKPLEACSGLLVEFVMGVALRPVVIPADPHALWLTLRFGAVTLPLRVTPAQLERFTGLSVDLLSRGDAAVEIENAIALWLNRVEDRSGRSMSVESLSDTPPAQGEPVELSVLLEDHDPITVFAMPDAAAAEFLSQRLTNKARHDDFRARPLIPCQLLLQRFHLSRRELVKLRAGDALACHRHKPDFLLVGGRHGLPIQIDDGGMQATGPLIPSTQISRSGPGTPSYGPNQGQQDMAQEHEPAGGLTDDFVRSDGFEMAQAVAKPPAQLTEPGQETPAGEESPPPPGPVPSSLEPTLDDVTVDVSAVVANMTLSYAQLEELQQGQLLQIADQDLVQVDLMVQGMKIGEGQLVMVGDAPAIEIVQLNGRTD